MRSILDYSSAVNYQDRVFHNAIQMHRSFNFTTEAFVITYSDVNSP